ncbi:MAG: roadblock/LC7 domain-containing protein [Candidatus Eiseniibacteriota bacterium]
MANWTLFEQDFRAVDAVLTELLRRAQALSVHLIDRSGQLITSVGADSDFDLPTFASLTAADVSANAELGNLFGKQSLETVVFVGHPRSMASTVIAERVILCVIFDRKSTLGLVRLRSKRAVQQLTPVFTALFQRLGLVPPAEVPGTALDLSAYDPDTAFRREASRRVDELLGGMLDDRGIGSDAIHD